MHKDQIVRKMLSTGEPVGPFCIIAGFMGNKSNLVRIKSLDGVIDSYIKRERIYECKMFKMVISNRTFERLEKGRQDSVIHDPTPRWLDMCKKDPEVIQFRSELYSNKIMLFTVEDVRKVYYDGQRSPRIRLYLGSRIL